MDASLKQRLIGAAVLVALAVIFLPMLIGGPGPDKAERRISTDIPNRQDRQLEARNLTLPPPNQRASGSAADAAVTAPDENRVVTVDTTDAPVRTDAVSGAPVGTSALPAPEVPATGASTPAPTPVIAEPAPAEPAPPVPVASATGRWAVNLGSYANADNAAKLVTQLRQQQLPAYTESTTLNDKTVQRVRLGPFAQRSEAESARLSVQKIRSDLPTGVVSLEGENAPPAIKTTVAEGFAIQLGALRSEVDANALRDRARKAGFASYVERIETSGGVLWRVRVGPELQRSSADKVKVEVKSKLGIDGNVVPHP